MPPSSDSPVVARITRDVVTARGPDAVTFLQGQLSQDVTALAVGDSAWSFVLQPQGKVDAWCRLHRSGDDEVVLDVDAGWGEALVTRLERFKLRTKCDLERTDGVPTWAVRGGRVDGGLDCGWPGVEGVDVVGAEGAPADLPADATTISADAFTALRIVQGVPAMGAELTESTIPAEAGQWVVDASVSFTKGCFTGQELVARIDSRGGNVPRRLRGFTADADGELPTAGTQLVRDVSVVGTVTSAARLDDRRIVGLAYVGRAHEPPFTAQLRPDGDDGDTARPADVKELPLA